MAIELANSAIVEKVNRVSNATGLSRSAVVELALDLWLSEMAEASDQHNLMADRLAQLEGRPYHRGKLAA